MEEHPSSSDWIHLLPDFCDCERIATFDLPKLNRIGRRFHTEYSALSSRSFLWPSTSIFLPSRCVGHAFLVFGTFHRRGLVGKHDLFALVSAIISWQIVFFLFLKLDSRDAPAFSFDQLMTFGWKFLCGRLSEHYRNRNFACRWFDLMRVRLRDRSLLSITHTYHASLDERITFHLFAGMAWLRGFAVDTQPLYAQSPDRVCVHLRAFM